MKKSKLGMLLLGMVFAFSLVLSACKATVSPDSETEETTDSTQQGNQQNTPEVTYTVTYLSAYGTLPDAIKNGISVKENTVLTATQLPVLSDENAVFKGWFDGETKAVAGIYKVTKDVTLRARWDDKATVTYSSLFGTVPTSFEVNLNTEFTDENLQTVECSPYTFLGWFYDKEEGGNGSGIQAAAGDKIQTDVLLTAKWKTATINFETQFGEALPITKYTGQTIGASEIKELSHEGYTFGGWFDGNTKLVADTVVSADVTYTAKWTANTYKVTFKANGGNGSDVEQTFTFDNQASSLTANGFSKTGYSFQGWAASPDSTAVVYTDGQNFSTPARDTTLYAVWKANNYTITFDSNNGTGNTTTQTVTFDKTVKLNAHTFEYHGYSFAAWTENADGSGNSYSDQGDFSVTKDSNITLYAKWIEADRCVISYQNTKGVSHSNPDSYRESEGATISGLALTGYVFEGWYDSCDTNGNGSGNLVTSWCADERTGAITLYAKWSPRTDTAYKVEHYQENADDDEYSLLATQNLTGTTDAQTEAAANTYEHFTAQAFVQTAIKPDGSSVVKIYYKRDTVTMNFVLDGGKIGEESSVTKSGKYGETFTVEDPQKTGWTFASWSPALPQKMDNGTFTATYTANTNTPYKVYHYQQNADDDEYTLKDTDNMTGTTLEQTAATAKTYEHFTAGTVTQKEIAADGSTELSIYYNRETVTFTLVLDGGKLDGDEGQDGKILKTGKWGQTVAINKPGKQRCEFLGWNTVGGTLPTLYETSATYTAKWSTTKFISITVMESDVEVTKSVEGNVITFTTEDNQSYGYRWYLDDEEVGYENTFSIDTGTLSKGVYLLVFELTTGDRVYSYSAQIKVGE